MLPADSDKNSPTSINSIELRPWTGIRTPTIVIILLLSSLFNQSSFFITLFNLSLVRILSPFKSVKLSNFVKSPCNAILIFIAEVIPLLAFSWYEAKPSVPYVCLSNSVAFVNCELSKPELETNTSISPFNFDLINFQILKYILILLIFLF